MTVTNDTVHALRIGELLIDAETGEILSETDYDLDQLALFLKDGQEQVKSWEAYVGAIKSAIGRKLDQDGVTKAVTPYGVATWRTQVRKSADAALLEPLAESLGLTERDELILRRCAKALDPKQLEAVRDAIIDGARGTADEDVAADHPLCEAVDALIQEKTIHYVQLMPLRRAAPVIERVELSEAE